METLIEKQLDLKSTSEKFLACAGIDEVSRLLFVETPKSLILHNDFEHCIDKLQLELAATAFMPKGGVWVYLDLQEKNSESDCLEGIAGLIELALFGRG
jgi:hypothetical protein